MAPAAAGAGGIEGVGEGLSAEYSRGGPGGPGHGYYLVARDGGVFTFGDAEFHGSGVGDTRARGHFEAIGNAWDHDGYHLLTNHTDVLSFGGAGADVPH